MRILAIDPGTRIAGYAVLDTSSRAHCLLASGVLLIRGNDLSQKLLCLYRAIERLCRRYGPREIAIERPFVGKSGAGTLTLASARAVCLLAAAAVRIRVFEYAPAEVKRAVSMNGLARKGDVQRSVQLLLRLPAPLPSDAADAAALAFCHWHRGTSPC